MNSLLLAVPFLISSVLAETGEKESTFELKYGDRVIFLGNTLIEREQKYGYWEAMLTARWPDRHITFRNLGWSGDTVWAESRGIFDPPAKGYQRMIEHVGRIKPTVIFLGYGNNEAFAGEKGLVAFLKQYNKLMNDLTKVSAKGVRFVILSPIEHENLGPPLPDPAEINRKLSLFTDALKELSREREANFIDLFNTSNESARYVVSYDIVPSENQTYNGHHLTKAGYYVTGIRIREGLLNWQPNRKFTISADGKVGTLNGASVDKIQADSDSIHFQVTKNSVHAEPTLVRVMNLRGGRHRLLIDGNVVETSDVDGWEQGRLIQRDPDMVKFDQLRQAIIEKNLLYFYHWRPQNITYLTGFRKHEQGQNAKETAEFEKLVKQKEAEITKLRKPVPHTYELIRVKAGAK